MTNKEWASLVPWEEVVARSRGRAKYNAIRKVRAQVRRLAIVQRLRQTGLHRGVQRQLAEEFGVVPSVICTDVRQILAQGLSTDDTMRSRPSTGTRHRSRPGREDEMSQRRTIRLPESLHVRLVAAAEAHQCGVSDVMRLALTSYFDNQQAGTSASLAPAPHHALNDCINYLLTALPITMQAELRDRASRLGWPVSSVVWQRLHAIALPPADPRPKGSATPSDRRGDTA